MQTQSVDVHEVADRLSEILDLVATGTEVVLTDGPMPVARITAVGASPGASPAQPRVPDLHPEAMRTSDDFDAPLPDELWLGRE